EDGVMIYNDAYSVFAGGRHPQLLGSKVREGWPEVADFNDNVMKVGLAGGTLAYRDQELTLHRSGKPEQVWMNLDYSPILDESGKPAGVMAIVVETTEHMRADTELRRSEERLRLATENAGVGLWDIDANGGIDFSYSRDRSSFVMAQNERVPMEHLLGQLHPDDAVKLRAAYDAARDPATRAMLDVEYRVLPTEDAPLRWIKVRGRGVFDADGNCVRISGTALDVTHERETQEALARSEEQLRLATENAEIGMWDMDVVNNRNFSHPRVKMMFGIPPDEDPSSEDFFALVHKDDVARVEAAYASAFDPEKRATYEVEYRATGRDDGIERWIHAKGRGVFDATGRCLRVTGTAVDITARKRVEEQARDSEARFRTLFESIDDGFCIIEAIMAPDGAIADFRYIEENPALAKRSGIVGALGHTVREMLPTEADGWIEILAKVLTSGEPMRFERFLETTGRLLELYVLRIDPKERGQVAVLFQDITERRNSEMRLHELNETLEKRVAERTLALEKSQAALQQAQKMEAIGNLTGGIAHDFNNLLQGLTGSLDLIRNKPQDVERVRRWAEAGLQAAERGAKLTAQLLAFSRAQKLELKPIVLATLLEHMRDLLGRTLGPSVRVIMDPPENPKSVLGDETQLEMSVLNLAINARDAMPDGGELRIMTRPLTITDDPELSPGEYLELRVTDTGSGMPAEVIARAFDPFFTTKGVGKGTGLGLSQVYGMAQQAGGIARIRSTSGQGTTVSIFLRATAEGAAQNVRAAQREDLDMAAPATILVVDDDPGVRQFLADSLDSFGYAVLEAENGEAGLEMLSRAAPDLMLVDYAMPGMTGAEVARRARETHAHMPIVFASGYAETAALENVLDENTLILRKPFRLGDLQDAIAKALRR
ncbi:MAG TPA: PAS domain S-box protein, partial [Rhizomicrobium sp.]|nr:PAS domain S-box protein [Rhizomicrobium sp.]